MIIVSPQDRLAPNHDVVAGFHRNTNEGARQPQNENAPTQGIGALGNRQEFAPLTLPTSPPTINRKTLVASHRFLRPAFARPDICRGRWGGARLWGRDDIWPLIETSAPVSAPTYAPTAACLTPRPGRRRRSCSPAQTAVPADARCTEIG